MKRSVLVIAAVAIIIALGVWGYSAYRTHTTRAAITVLVKESGERLRPALSPADVPADFDAAARAADGDVATLRKLDTRPVLPLADAADGYLVSVREILRRRAVMHNVRDPLAKGLEALTQHLQTDRGAAAWTGEAVRLRDSLERDFREYRIATESYVALLETLPAAQSKIAEHVNGVRLADEKTIRDARSAALDALARTDENIGKVTQLDAYRGQRRKRGSR
jgi:hypothetical protein